MCYLCMNYAGQLHGYSYYEVPDITDHRSHKTFKQSKEHSVQHFWLYLPQLLLFIHQSRSE